MNFAPENHPMYDFSDPRRFGPGMWLSFMIMALQSESQKQRGWTCKHIRDSCSFLRCLSCRRHAQLYLYDHPPELFAIDNERLFLWLVDFMNAVNERKGKPLYDAHILFRQFVDDEFMVCDSDCDKDSSSVDTQHKPLRSRRSFALARHKP